MSIFTIPGLICPCHVVESYTSLLLPLGGLASRNQGRIQPSEQHRVFRLAASLVRHPLHALSTACAPTRRDRHRRWPEIFGRWLGMQR